MRTRGRARDRAGEAARRYSKLAESLFTSLVSLHAVRCRHPHSWAEGERRHALRLAGLCASRCGRRGRAAQQPRDGFPPFPPSSSPFIPFFLITTGWRRSARAISFSLLFHFFTPFLLFVCSSPPSFFLFPPFSFFSLLPPLFLPPPPPLCCFCPPPPPPPPSPER